MLTIQTLGHFDIHIDGQSQLVNVDIRRGLLLLYLAEMRQPQPREDIGRLLWPEIDADLTRTTLRSLLRRMRADGFAPYLNSTRSTLSLNFDAEIMYDVAELRRQASATGRHELASLRRAVDLYQGSFMADRALDAYPGISDWVDTVQRELEVFMMQVYTRITPRLIETGDIAAAIHSGERLVELAPFHDEAQMHFVRALTADGQVARALRHLALYRATMTAEFGAEPSLELKALHAQLLRPDHAAKLVAPVQAPPAIPERRQLPYTVRAIVGRKRETELLFSLLESRQRLISLVGMGGVGKTFFICSQLAALEREYGERLYFVDLRNIEEGTGSARDTLLGTVASALQLTPEPGDSLIAQIAAALVVGPSFLILDNFEAVQSAAVTVLELLRVAPHLTILVTSRQRLNLIGEVILTMAGLPVDHLPSGAHETSVAQMAGMAENGETQSAALTLFARSAMRVVPGFTINADNQAQVIALCRKLGGLPLAIELAALQLDFYSVEELTAVISDEADVLAADHTDRPLGHRSMERVLTSMWGTLSSDAQRVLSGLSLFANVFSREEMFTVVPAPRTVYNELVNASLLQAEGLGWFSLHPLIKQYGAYRLPADSESSRRHAAFFLGLLDLGEQLLERGKVQAPAVFQRLQRRQDDIFVAWRWAIAHHAWDMVAPATISLGSYCHVAHNWSGGIQLLGALIDALSATVEQDSTHKRMAGQAALLATSLCSVGGLLDHPLFNKWSTASLSWLEAAGTPYEISVVNHNRGYRLAVFGHAKHQERGVAMLKRSVALAAQHGFDDMRQFSASKLLHYYIVVGKWADLESMDNEAYALLQDSPALAEDSFNTACLISLHLGHWQEARERLKGYDHYVRARSDYDQHLPWIVRYRVYLMIQQGEWRAGISTLQSSLVDNYETTHATMMCVDLSMLAFCFAHSGDHVEALQTVQRTVVEARQTTEKHYSGYAFLVGGATLALIGEEAFANELLVEAITTGLELSNTILVFSSLYHLTMLHVEELPQCLYQKVAKIGAVCPAMYFPLRQLGLETVQREGICIEDDEREYLWTTSLEEVLALAKKTARFLPEIPTVLMERDTS